MPESTLDVVIVGAGVSGIGAAWHLQHALPGYRYAIVEARAELGGTWDLFRYPGVRSDSDLFTFGYAFRPWRGEAALADGASIKEYLQDTAREAGIDRHILFRHRVVRADWCSARRRWELQLRDAQQRSISLRARWIFCASGYYRHDQGHTPHFDGRERFCGRIVHPQQWPDDLDCKGRRVIVIGSGATAVTLLPQLARDAAHVTMLQRTPTYILPVASRDRLAPRLRRWLGEPRTHALMRALYLKRQQWVYALCRRHPDAARRLIRHINARLLPAGVDVDRDFRPPYAPWDQRLCVVPDGDLFRALRDGRASVVTDSVACFTRDGLRLASGRELGADIVVTATGLRLLPFGGIELHVDGAAVRLPQCVAFKGMMLSGVPNLAFAIGYTSASWTLKVGLVCEHFCRLLRHMQRRGLDSCTARAEPGMATRPLLDFGAGYVRRALAELPRQGAEFPWAMSWNYAEDRRLLLEGRVDDPQLHFTARAQRRTRNGEEAMA